MPPGRKLHAADRARSPAGNPAGIGRSDAGSGRVGTGSPGSDREDAMSDGSDFTRRHVLVTGGTAAAAAPLLRGHLATPALVRRPSAAGAPPPEQVHVQFGADAATEAAVSWGLPVIPDQIRAAGQRIGAVQGQLVRLHRRAGSRYLAEQRRRVPAGRRLQRLPPRSCACLRGERRRSLPPRVQPGRAARLAAARAGACAAVTGDRLDRGLHASGRDVLRPLQRGRHRNQAAVPAAL